MVEAERICGPIALKSKENDEAAFESVFDKRE